MKILILNHTEVEQLLPMHECIDVMKEAFAALAAPLSSILERAPALGLTIPDSWRDRLWLAAESDESHLSECG